MSGSFLTIDTGDNIIKSKSGIFNCVDDILRAHETAVVLPGRGDMDKIHPIVIVEPKIEIKVELQDQSDSDRLIESLLHVPDAKKNKSKSKSARSANGSVSPHSNASNESARSRHHHRHHHHAHHHRNHTTDNSAHKHTHHHHHHRHATNHDAVAGEESAASAVPRPDQVLRKYIIKKITIRKQDGSTKKIVIKKPVDEPNAPLKLSKVHTSETRDRPVDCTWF